MVISRQTYIQNFLSVLGFMLIICYYAFNGIPEESFKAEQYASEKAADYENSVELEKSISQLRAAILMDADGVHVNGLLYQLEMAITNLSTEHEAKTQIQSIYSLLLEGNKRAAVKRINQLRTQLVQQLKTAQ